MVKSLDACVQQILKDAEFPAFSQQIQQIMTLDQGDRSAQELAAIVLQDYGLTLKVLQVANSFQYNRSNRSIDNVSRAIMIMGVQTVVSLASTLLFFDHYQKRSGPLKKLMLLSMLSSHHTGGAAAVLGARKKEEAQLAGMFRNLGEVLVACHLPSQYALISLETQGGAQAPTRACLKTLGFSYDTLAKNIGQYWKLPPQLTAMWSPPPNGRLDDLSALAQFGYDAMTVMYRRTTGDYSARLQLLAMQHGHRLSLTEDTIETIIDRAVEETQPLFTMMHMTVDDIRLGPSVGRQSVSQSVSHQSPVSQQSPVTGHQSVTSRQSPVTSQSQVDSHKSTVTSRQSQVDSRQSPVTSRRSPVNS